MLCDILASVSKNEFSVKLSKLCRITNICAEVGIFKCMICLEHEQIFIWPRYNSNLCRISFVEQVILVLKAWSTSLLNFNVAICTSFKFVVRKITLKQWVGKIIKRVCCLLLLCHGVPIGLTDAQVKIQVNTKETGWCGTLLVSALLKGRGNVLECLVQQNDKPVKTFAISFHRLLKILAAEARGLMICFACI